MRGIGRGYLFNRLPGIHLAYGLVLVLLVGGAYMALRRPCSQALAVSHSPAHGSLAQYYWEETSRLAADSLRHSTLALQYGAKGVSGPDAKLWRALAEYNLLLAGYEIKVAEILTVLAVLHVQLEHSPPPPGAQEGPP